jgi:hypothetical protein
MTSAKKPVLFSTAFGIDSAKLDSLGVFDPTLNIDTLLFPDPLLCESSAHPEIRKAREAFDEHFEQVRRLLYGSKGKEGPALRAVRRKLSFPEIKGTCLGYGRNGIAGSGAGPKMTQQLIETGLEIVQLGIDDPDLFLAMGLFEKDFGPDLVGDMFTNVALVQIASFNDRIQKAFGYPFQEFSIPYAGGTLVGNFPANSLVEGVPVILLPKDILRDLPVAVDWRDVQEASDENERFREKLNGRIAEVWSKKTLENKAELKRWALSGSEAFGDLLDILHGMDGKPYDFLNDPKGEIAWRTVVDRVIAKYPLRMAVSTPSTAADVLKIVDLIINRFTDFIEKRDLWRELYTDDKKPRLEKAAQRLFYLLAHSYCEANDLDITPEAETGVGPVDFKVSFGMSRRVLVEIKLSTNTQVVKGYEKQIEAYRDGEGTLLARYVIIDVGSLGNKFKRISDMRVAQASLDDSTLKAVLIDGMPKESASNRK